MHTVIASFEQPQQYKEESDIDKTSTTKESFKGNYLLNRIIMVRYECRGE